VYKVFLDIVNTNQHLDIIVFSGWTLLKERLALVEVDHKLPKEIASLFNISVDEVDLIVQKHQEYRDEQTKNNYL
jgi:hypothetical protein